MSVFDKGYYTFSDLMNRWSIGREELISLIFRQKIVPSYFINHGQKVSKIRFTEDKKDGGWKKDESFPIDYASPRFVYLRFPSRISLNECRFFYGCQNSSEPLDGAKIKFWNWYEFENPIISSDAEIVFLKSQVSLFERQYVRSKTAQDESAMRENYPWGDHNTKLMTHLSNAAIKFWSLYDPSDYGTAPTNDQVTKWLVTCGVGERTAQVMATILRADGLPMGRR